MSEDKTTTEERSDEQRSEDKPAAVREPAGSLRVEERAEGVKFVSLTEEFRSRGFPGEAAWVSADEFRSASFGGTIDVLDQQKAAGVPLGADQRYAWQAVPQVSVDAGVTSVQVFQQTARTLTAGTATIRAIDATTNKPETSSTLNVLTVPLKQVAGVQTGIPNVYLEQSQLASVVENDLRLSINDGLDELVRAGLALSGNQAPSSDNILVSIRKAITTLRASGYTPDTLLLTPTASETIDTMVSGISGGTADFTFGAGRFAPGTLFGLRVRVEGARGTRCVGLERQRKALPLSDQLGEVRGERRANEHVPRSARRTRCLRRRADCGGYPNRLELDVSPSGRSRPTGPGRALR